MFEELSNDISDTGDIKNLRDANVNTTITLDNGTSYMPFNLGQSLAGFSAMFSVKMINVAKDIHSLISTITQEQINIGFQIKTCEVSQLNFLADGRLQFIELKLSDGKDDKYLEFYKE